MFTLQRICPLGHRRQPLPFISEHHSPDHFPPNPSMALSLTGRVGLILCSPASEGQGKLKSVLRITVLRIKVKEVSLYSIDCGKNEFHLKAGKSRFILMCRQEGMSSVPLGTELH